MSSRSILKQMIVMTFVVLYGATPALAQATFNLKGRLISPSGVAVAAAAVSFRVQVRTPAPSDCLLFEEVYTKDLSQTAGFFSLSLNDGTASVVNTEPFAFDQIFRNQQTMTFSAGKCSMGTSFTPASSDTRDLVVFFNDGSFAGWEPLPRQTISQAPVALESSSVGGFAAANLFRVIDGSGNPVAMTPWTQANYQSLIDIIAGTAGIPGNSAGFTGPLAGDVTGTQGVTSVVRLQGRDVFNSSPNNGDVLTWNNAQSRWEALAPAGGGAVVSVSGTAPISVTGTTTPVVSLMASGVTTSYLADGAVSNLKIAAAAVSTAQIADGSVTTLKLADGNVITAKLADSSVSTVKMIDGSVTSAKLDSSVANGLWAYSGGNVSRSTGNVAIGSGTAVTRLDVAGGLKIGNEASSCDGTFAGTFRYNGGSMQFCNGSAWMSLGISGAGLTALNGQTGASQAFSIGTAGVAPIWSSGSDTHTLNIPMASSVSVTAGLISKTDYDSFNSKLSTVSGSPLNSGQIWVGNGGNMATAVTMSGDGSLSSSGIMTIGANAITTSKIDTGAVTIAKLSTAGASNGQTVRFMGGAWSIDELEYGDLVNSFGGDPWPSTTCSVGQAVVWSSAADAFTCAILTPVIPAATIGTTELADGSVTTSKLADSGVTWAKLSTGLQDGLWASVSGDVARVNGNVGIGIALPSAPLHVVREGATAMAQLDSAGSSQRSAVALRKANGTVLSPTGVVVGDPLGQIQWHGYDGSGFGLGAWIGALTTENWYGSGHGTRLIFATTGNGTTTPAARMVIDPNGNIGLGGVVNPTAPLHLGGPAARMVAQDTDTSMGGSIAAVLELHAGAAVVGAFGFTGSQPEMIIENGNGGSSTVFTMNGVERMRLTDPGQVGINRSNPQATLDVNGFMRLTPMSSQPAACSPSNQGSIALTSLYRICACNGSNWVFTHDGSTSCSW